MEFMRDEETGDYVVDDTGRPESDTTLSPAIRTRLRGHRGKWMHAPDPTWGSDFWRYKKKRSVDFRDDLDESIALSAVEPLAKDGRAENFECETQFQNRGGVAYKLRFLDRQKQAEFSVTTPVGA